MKPVAQTTMTPGGGGNCIAACVASIFEVPLWDVFPQVPNGGDYTAMCEWTRERYPGLACQSRMFSKHNPETNVYENHHIPLDELDVPFIPRGYWIGCGISPRGVIDRHGNPSLHAVVLFGREIAWDPHPRRDMGVGDIGHVYWWAVQDPSKL